MTLKQTEASGSGIREIETAYHEAGHAIIAYLKRSLMLNSATIKPNPDKNRLGAVSHYNIVGDGWRGRRETIETNIMLCLAGDFSVFVLNGEVNAGGRKDWREVEHLAKAAYIKPTDEKIFKLVAKVEDKTWNVLKKNWKYVKAVAEELLKYKTLSGDEIGALVDSMKCSYIISVGKVKYQKGKRV